jgi:hypothetical protein
MNESDFFVNDFTKENKKKENAMAQVEVERALSLTKVKRFFPSTLTLT